MKTFEKSGNGFLLNGKPFRIFAGAMHYFRVHPDLWEDRLRKLKAMGLNTLETYTAWNMHEPKPGVFTFTGFGDLERYLQLADNCGFQVLIRSGPYICSERDFGALPAWLLTIPGIRIRCYNKPYLDAVERYFNELLPRINRFSCAKGGPVIGVQIENEYGSYGNDKRYLRAISGMLNRHLPGVMQFTSDGPTYGMLNGGTLPDAWATVNFGSRAKEAFQMLEEFRPGDPRMCCEYWNGWFDHWGERHHIRSLDEAENALREILDNNGNVSFYMFHGGTNFGLQNGANCSVSGEYQPTVSSYDFDAPLNEHGGITPKYEMFRRVFAEYGSGPGASAPLPETLPVKAYGTVPLTERAVLFDNLDRLSKPVSSAHTPYMEDLGQNFGFILYHTRLIRDISEENRLTVDEPRDRAQVYVNRKHVATVYCNDKSFDFHAEAKENDSLDILVENMGRINYGMFMERRARKGITNGFTVDNQIQFGWDVYSLPMEDLSGLVYEPADEPLSETPCFHRGFFEVDTPVDTFLKIPGRKGIAFINGFNLGRYWEIGPTHTLYIPAPLLKKGRNELVVFELHQLDSLSAELTDKAEL